MVIFMGLAVAGYLVLRSRAEQVVKLDAEDCPVDGPTSVTAFLLDLTDPISDITLLDLQNQFKTTVSAVEKGGLIEVYALTEDEGHLDRTYRGCNPGDSSEADLWTSNPVKIQKRWEKAFKEPLEKIRETLGRTYQSKRSPIMAGIQRIVIEGFADPRTGGRPRALYVASDMMEYTERFSIYKSGPDYKAFERSAARDRFRTPLDDIQVKFLVFQREASAHATGLPEFWATWVGANHGSFAGYERLMGIM
ncbi:hypothetical protein LAV84_20965 [Rhizobium sp. VS19-DR104.2]|uniref:hypothetical protein n=1 Tax=unclassified Rhizobium TaxID=2613769 RepID=UPI001CC3A3EC|nr:MULTISPECIES: hypothetical protein [unclassified Rhizobium]MBZ5762404.1 hypothetical protein [Rhizobium sp. VS19-DR96]MBZ5768445.1 hypothetical protein [Rhizobium sp. VS19-DR129.2]MBZ5776099.1 hypothetical protein [Rhizobium sp. VS19-DRK62.2]MBZ5786210.1 hypothetical protein [Rhizobium sp. VS19-DR121]MBZ5804482.1 hypothetical protein [Rhizobium sp. VS19-DR181]